VARIDRHDERSHAQAGDGRADQSGQGDGVVVELLGQPDLADTRGENAASLIDEVVDGVDRRRAPMKNYSGGHVGDNPPGRRRYSFHSPRAQIRGHPWLRVTRQCSRPTFRGSFVGKLQRLRPPRWTSQRVTATEATTAATSRMFVIRAIYREAGRTSVNDVDAVKTRNRNRR
jgi:hypothetical protein